MVFKNEGTLVINIYPDSISEKKFMSYQVQRILKERFNMVSTKCALGVLFGLNKNRYTLTFDTRDKALQAAAWLNDILRPGAKVE